MFTDITSPAGLAVSLDTAKLHLRVDQVDQGNDELIQSYIMAAIDAAERYTGRAFNQRYFRMDEAEFGAGCRFGGLRIDKAPVVAVDSVKYRDDAGDLQTIAPESWSYARTSYGALIQFASGFSFPSLFAAPDAVQVQFLAGYDSPDYSGDTPPSQVLPSVARQAILLTVGHYYANRESIITGTISVELPQTATYLLDQLRIYTA